MSHFHTFAKKIHVPFSKISSIRADFRIHIMSLTADDSLFEVAEFFGLSGLGSASVIRTLIKVNAHEVFYSKEVARLLALDEASSENLLRQEETITRRQTQTLEVVSLEQVG